MTATASTDLTPRSAASHRYMANALRALAMDAVEAANSGHPGMPMGMADVATVLFTRFLKFDAADPNWPDRDRFVLSAGHGSMLLYGLLYLTGVPGMSIDEIKRFRQLGSKTPGHPEFGCAAGVETTTGPLGQGLANAVGMAIAERLLAARFGDSLVDHHTYAIVGDGCLMEGVSHEAISLAGHLRLRRLIVLFDDNRISIDGATSLTTSDDQLARFAASGWRSEAIDGHDPDAIARAITAAKAADRPTLIACRTIIGYGAPTKQGSAATHGSPLGTTEVAAARQKLGWPHPAFAIPTPVQDAWRGAGHRGQSAHQQWQRRLDGLDPAMRAEWRRSQAGQLPAGWAAGLADYKAALIAKPASVATRQASQNVLEVINAIIPDMIGGSADLTGSNNTKTKDLAVVTADNFAGRYLHYGVREHGMAAAMNGIALHRGLIPYGGTFLVFSDYLRPAMRLSALMEQRVIYVLTHDSIGLGEDGPTHQPVEHMAALRSIPHLLVFRPADAVETAECWDCALRQGRRPSVLALTRQALPPLRFQPQGDNLCARGAYEIAAAEGPAAVTLLASGSEVSIAVQARDLLRQDGVLARVVSVPCWELFEEQSNDYRRSVLGPGTVRVAVEAGVRQGWDRFVGERGRFVGMTGFGASAPYQDLYNHFGITAAAVAQAARDSLAAEPRGRAEREGTS